MNCWDPLNGLLGLHFSSDSEHTATCYAYLKAEKNTRDRQTDIYNTG